MTSHQAPFLINTIDEIKIQVMWPPNPDSWAELECLQSHSEPQLHSQPYSIPFFLTCSSLVTVFMIYQVTPRPFLVAFQPPWTNELTGSFPFSCQPSLFLKWIQSLTLKNYWPGIFLKNGHLVIKWLHIPRCSFQMLTHHLYIHMVFKLVF